MEPKPREPVGKTPMLLLVVFMSVGVVLSALCFRQLALGNTKDALSLLVAGALFAVGPILLFFFRKAHEQRARTDLLRRQADPTPWLARDDWAKCKFVQRDKHPPYIIGGVATIVFGAVSKVLSAQHSGAGTYFDPLAFVWFGSVGAILLLLGIGAFIRRKKFGESVFKISPVPGLIGGKLEGKIEIGARLEPPHGFTVRLRCPNVTSRRKNSCTTTLCEQTQHVRTSAPADDPARSAIPVAFTIPEGCPETDDAPGNKVTWLLEARARVPGTDYLATFEVPVFRLHPGQTSATLAS